MNKCETNKLYHHGILGMKWGVRRYQNKDGTLTSAGKKRQLTNSDILVLKGVTKNGKAISAVQDKEPAIAKWLAKYNINMQNQIKNTKNMTLYDGDDQIGELQLFHESPTSINVMWLGVRKKYRGNGYASATMKMVEDYARKVKAKQITLEVPGDAPDARHIYEKLGFIAGTQISELDDVWGGLTCMKKDIM